MYEKLRNCPICSSMEFQNKHICKDYLVGQESFVIVECMACGFHFTNPRPDSDHIEPYYRSKNYKSHHTRSFSIADILYRIARNFSLSRKRKILEQYNKPPGNLLDIGCGTGEFLLNCKKAGWTVSGIEPNSKASKLASAQLNISIYSSLTQLPDDQKYTTITLWHVLEHVHDLQTTIKHILEKLNKGGTLFVAVPNRDSYDAQFYKEYWAGWDVPRHLYHFNTKDMKNLFDSKRAKIVAKLPMPLDSYYVSLLSEEYKTGRKRYLKAFISGKKSNQVAKLNTNYSSLLYVIKK